MNNRTKSNNTLRQKIKGFLKKIPRGDTFHVNQLVSSLSKINKNYTITSPRVANLLKEQENIVRFVKSGVWLKL